MIPPVLNSGERTQGGRDDRLRGPRGSMTRKTGKSLRAVLAGGGGLCLALSPAASPVLRAEAGLALAAEAAPQIEEIVITATKRETVLRRTPIAVSAITGAQLDFLDARDFNAYAARAPGLSAIDQGVGRKRYIIRGISTQDSNLSQATVAQYLDEVPITNSFGQQPDPRLVDVERVEVLRGPQGTTFGARSMAGAVRTITRKPVMDRYEGSVQVTGSGTRFGGLNAGVEGTANAPLVNDVLALRVAAFYTRNEGYIDNVFPGGTFVAQPGQLPPGRPLPPPVTIAPIDEENFSDATIYGGRAALRWRPSDDLTVDVMGLAQKSETGGAPFYNVQASGDESGGLISQIIGNDGNEDTLLIGTATVSYDLGGAILTAVASYADRDNANAAAAVVAGVLSDSGPGSTRAFGGKTGSTTVEARLASTGDGPLQWLGGAYAFWQYIDNHRRDYIGYADDVASEELIDDDSRESAVFGEVSYTVLDRLTATAGVRYARYNSRLQRFVVISVNSGPLGYTPVQKFDEDALTWKFQLAGQLTDTAFVYATVAEGFRPGGFNASSPPGVTGVPADFGSDTLWSYEVGAKTTRWGERVSANGALYKVDWNDMQAVGYARGLGPNLISYTTNAGSAEIIGAELEMTVRPARSLSFDLALNHFLKAELTSDMPETATGLAPRAGDPLPNNARWSFNLGGEYRRPLGAALEGFARLDWSYVGRRTTGFRPHVVSGAVNNAYNDFAPYGLVDLRLGVGAAGWRASLFVENLFDARPAVTQQNFDPLPVTLRVTRKPRTVGASLRRAW